MAGRSVVTAQPRDVAEVPERDEILGIERQRRLEGRGGIRLASRLEETLAVHDQPVHVAGRLREVFLAEQNGTVDEARLAVLVREGREVALGILVIPLAQFVDAVRSVHPVGVVGKRCRVRVQSEDTMRTDCRSNRSARPA